MSSCLKRPRHWSDDLNGNPSVYIQYFDNGALKLARVQKTSREHMNTSRCKYRIGLDSSWKIVGPQTILVMLGYRTVRLKLSA